MAAQDLERIIAGNRHAEIFRLIQMVDRLDEQTARGATALARRAFGSIVHALCKGRRAMACAMTSLVLMAMFGIIVAGLAFGSNAEETASTERQEAPAAPSGDHVIA